jgi:hypothetical protein
MVFLEDCAPLAPPFPETFPHVSPGGSSPPQVIVLDVDDTENPVHGGQAQARWDGDEGGAGFFPCHVYEGLAGRLLPTILKAKRCTGAPRFAGRQRLAEDPGACPRRPPLRCPGGDAVERSAPRQGLRDGLDAPRRVAPPGLGGRRAGQPGLWARWGPEPPLARDPGAGRDGVALASGGAHGRAIRPRGQHPRCGDRPGAGPYQGA